MKTATRERPILFSGPMVRAILGGRKTQTRRAMKPQPTVDARGDWYWQHSTGRIHCASGDRPSIYGTLQVGDRLWVRETWASYTNDTALHCVTYRATPGSGFQVLHEDEGEGDPVELGAAELSTHTGPWRPSIFMPRWASRITLEITDVRVQRLQEISDEDAIAEGAQCAGIPASLTNVGAFAKLWENINGEGSWAANPWVWAITFKRITP